MRVQRLVYQRTKKTSLSTFFQQKRKLSQHVQEISSIASMYAQDKQFIDVILRLRFRINWGVFPGFWVRVNKHYPISNIKIEFKKWLQRINICLKWENMVKRRRKFWSWTNIFQFSKWINIQMNRMLCLEKVYKSLKLSNTAKNKQRKQTLFNFENRLEFYLFKKHPPLHTKSNSSL